MEPSGADGGFPEPLDGQYGSGKAKNVMLELVCQCPSVLL